MEFLGSFTITERERDDNGIIYDLYKECESKERKLSPTLRFTDSDTHNSESIVHSNECSIDAVNLSECASGILKILFSLLPDST